MIMQALADLFLGNVEYKKTSSGFTNPYQPKVFKGKSQRKRTSRPKKLKHRQKRNR